MPLRRFVGLAMACVVLTLAGCSGASSSASGTAAAASSGPATPVAARSAATAVATTEGDIPAGRSIAEGGGGTLTYTFREEWRRARLDARNWRAGAYLVSAVGSFVNDDGIPSQWTFCFADRASIDAVFIVEIDPWGKVTASRNVTGEGLSSFVNQYTHRIPYEVIDSDTAVGIGKAALAADYDLAKTRDPRLSLDFSSTDGSGPYWTYTLFHVSTANYVSARIHAITSAVAAS